MGGRGARSAVAKTTIRKGMTTTVSLSAAVNALKHGFSVRASGGRSVRFTYDLYYKYVEGKGRKNNQSAKERLYQLGKAVMAVKKANLGVILLPFDNPPQKVFLHQWGKRSGMVVFADTEKRTVRGFINVENIGKWKKNILERKKRLPDQ